MGDWGDMDNDTADTWGDEFGANSQDTIQTPKSSAASVSFDDGGEPDFEGWLNAQTQAKAQSKRQLPKGLVRKPAATVKAPAITKSNVAVKSAPPSGTSKSGAPAEPEEEDDEWGDAWS